MLKEWPEVTLVVDVLTEKLAGTVDDGFEVRFTSGLRFTIASDRNLHRRILAMFATLEVLPSPGIATNLSQAMSNLCLSNLNQRLRQPVRKPLTVFVLTNLIQAASQVRHAVAKVLPRFEARSARSLLSIQVITFGKDNDVSVQQSRFDESDDESDDDSQRLAG